ncbi:MAG TPA: M14 family zinc carboxypeptidase [bacterium]|nr:M14 family zinc carboxypeptidase [bacterium]
MKRTFILILFFGALAAAYATVTSPVQFLGFTPGDDHQLADYETIISYFKELEQESDRLLLQELGRTTQGRPLYLAVISAPQNLRDRKRIIARQARLARPLGLSAGEAKKLIEQAPVIVSINCSIHPREIGASQMSMELAYRLLNDRSPEMQMMLNKVVLLLMPSQNPDGLDAIVRGYEKNLRAGRPDAPISQPDHPYAGHDLNRDWFMLSQKETRLTVEKVYNVWRPHIVFDLHQMGSAGGRMFLPPYVDPYDPYIDPLLQAGLSALGHMIAMDMTALGLSGIVHNLYFDSYSPARSYIPYHGGVRVLGEIASAHIATPIQVEETDLHGEGDFHPLRRSWRQPLPWTGGRWSLADIVRYGLEASLALLRHAASDRRLWVANVFQALKRQATGDPKPDYYIFPMDQHDMFSLYELLSLLRTGLVDIYRTTAPLQLAEGTLPPPVYVIPGQQPYAAYARTLLQQTRYEEVAPPGSKPYDVTTHYLPGLLGVRMYRFEGPLPDLEYVSRLPRPRLTESGPMRGHGLLIDYRSNQAIRAVTRLFKAQAPVFWLRDSVSTTSADVLPAGTLYVDQTSRYHLNDLPVNLFYPAQSLSRPAWRLRPPAIGLFAVQAEADEGWIRFVLEEYGFDYTRLSMEGVCDPELAEKFDVIVFPDQSPERLRELFLAPASATGERNALDRLQAFVQSGGSLVMINRSCNLLVDRWALAVKNTVQDSKAEEYFVPGSLLRMNVAVDHPGGYGLPDRIAGFVHRSPVFQPLAPWVETVATYPDSHLLAGGFLRGERLMASGCSAACVALGKGRVWLLGFMPQFRAQSHATYKLLFNALFFSNAEAVERPE